MSDIDRTVLSYFLNGSRPQCHITPNATYKVYTPRGEYEIQFIEEMYYYRTRKGNATESRYVYDLKHIGSGHFAATFVGRQSLKRKKYINNGVQEFSVESHPKKNPIVIKHIRKNYPSCEFDTYIARVSNEIRLMRAAGYFDVRMMDCWIEGGERTIQMRLFPGVSLRDYIDNNLQKAKEVETVNQCLKLSRQLFVAYRYQLNGKVIHRDIKPENVLYDQVTGNLYYIDLGLSMLATDTNTTPCGSPAYMSPEAKNKEPLSEKSDIYSIGRILWEIWGQEKNYYSGHILATYFEKYFNLPDCEFSLFLFSKTSDDVLSKEIKEKLKNLIIKINKRDPADRPDLDECIRVIDECIADFEHVHEVKLIQAAISNRTAVTDRLLETLQQKMNNKKFDSNRLFSRVASVKVRTNKANEKSDDYQVELRMFGKKVFENEPKPLPRSCNERKSDANVRKDSDYSEAINIAIARV